MARGGKHGAKIASSPNVQAHRQADERTCPLCIEPLDATEQQFYPCACGYQLCLFCYDRIKTECGNLCPGCRTEYGSEKDVLKKSDSRQHRNSQSGFSSTEQSPLKHSPNSHRLPLPASKPGHASPGSRTRAVPAQAIAISPPAGPQSQWPQSSHSETADSMHAQLPSPAAKPAHASPGSRTRAVAAQAIPIPPPPPPARLQPQWPQGSNSEAAESMHASSDSSAPSPSGQAARRDPHRHLAAAAIPVPLRRRSHPAQQKQHEKPDMTPQLGVDSSSSRSEHAGSGGSARVEQSSSLQHNGGYSQPHARPAGAGQSPAGLPGFQSWRHQKKRRGSAPPDPEGATLALSMQQAVKRGQMSSAQGSARLLSFLQQKEAEQQMLSEACSSSIVGTMQAGQASQLSWDAQPSGSIWGSEAAAAIAGNHTLWSQQAAAGSNLHWPPWDAPGTTTGPPQRS